jgi:hypothetical protein
MPWKHEFVTPNYFLCACITWPRTGVVRQHAKRLHVEFDFAISSHMNMQSHEFAHAYDRSTSCCLRSMHKNRHTHVRLPDFQTIPPTNTHTHTCLQYRSPDFQGMPQDQALKEFKNRIDKYELVYKTISDDSLSYVKVCMHVCVHKLHVHW